MKRFLYYVLFEMTSPSVDRSSVNPALFSRAEFRAGQKSLSLAVQTFAEKHKRPRIDKLADKCQYLSLDEVVRLLGSIESTRDYALVLLMYRHGLRVTEAVTLRRADVNTATGTIKLRRLQRSISGEHPLQGDEIKAVTRYLKSRDDSNAALFLSRKYDEAIKRAQAHRLITAYAQKALIPVWKRHPHVLRHSIGVHLIAADTSLAAVRDWLGHTSIESTEVYMRIVQRYHNTQVGRAMLDLAKQ
jgi:type 1 fimbriae regulatory protein FimB